MRNLFAIFGFISLILCSQVAVGEAICSKGNFYNLTTQSCQICPAGTFTNGTVSLSQCEPCPAGSRAYDRGSSECSICQAGTYEVGRTSCSSCPKGTYSNAGAKNISECITCPAGYTAWKDGLKECTICEAGTYEVNRTSCYKCPKGTYSKAGAKDISECIACPAGSTAWKDGSTQCDICEAGTYEVNRTSCYKCPKGTTSFSGSKDVSECTACPAGYTAWKDGSTECTICGAGYYETNNRTSCYSCPKGTTSKAGAKDVSECIACPAGYTAWKDGSTECTICGAGYYETNNRTSCYSCPKGTSSKAGSKDLSECIACPAGYTAWKDGSTECTICGAGYYETNNRTSCYSCPKGTYSAKEGAKDISECIACPAGYRAYDQGSKECTICSAGTYEVNRTSCPSCPPGTSSNAGSKDISECSACPAGYRAHDYGSEKCTICPAGTYEVNRTKCLSCPPGTSSQSGSKDQSECIACPAGYRADSYGSEKCTVCQAGTYEVNRTSCRSCPKGTYSTKEGAIDISGCITCPAGYRADDYGSKECSICRAGTYEVNRTSCLSCPLGTTSKEGQIECIPCQAGYTRSNFFDNDCTICRAGTYEVNRTSCSDCPAGTISLAGAKNISECTPCGPGYYTGGKGSTVCQKCSAGSIGLNRTSCMQCPAGTFEVNGTQCSKCPNGTISLAGSAKCGDCPAGTVSVKNGTECRDPSQVEKEKEEEIPEKKNSNAMFYVLGIALVAIVIFAVVYKCSKKDVPEVENDKEIKISLVPQNSNQLDHAANYYY